MRVFVSVALPEKIKENISQIINDCKSCQVAPFKWVSSDNWHLTINFLGDQEESAIEDIKQSVSSTASYFRKPKIQFDDLILAPKGKQPRMIWITGTIETSQNLDFVKKYLDEELLKNNVKFVKDVRKYNCHLTLARFDSDYITEASNSVEEMKPLFDKLKPEFNFNSDSLDLVESHLKHSGAEYELLFKANFEGK